MIRSESSDAPPVVADLVRQFARFLVVGLMSFAVDYGLFVLLHEMLDVQYIIASSVSFAVSLVLNYYLSVRFVFVARSGRSVAAEFTLYIALNAVALGLNQLILLIAVESLGFDPLVGKLIATAVVLVFNFISRKSLIERGTSGRAARPKPSGRDRRRQEKKQ